MFTFFQDNLGTSKRSLEVFAKFYVVLRLSQTPRIPPGYLVVRELFNEYRLFRTLFITLVPRSACFRLPSSSGSDPENP